MSEENRWLTLALICMAITLWLLYSVNFVRAHDHARPELNKWFDGLQSAKGPCCSTADGTALADVDWQSKDGHYEVRLNETWIVVDDSAVIKEPNRDGRTIVWPFRTVYGETQIRCFMPGGGV